MFLYFVFDPVHVAFPSFAYSLQIIVSGGDGTHCPGDYEDSSVFTYEFDVD